MTVYFEGMRGSFSVAFVMPSEADSALPDVSICLHASCNAGCGSFGGVESGEREGV